MTVGLLFRLEATSGSEDDLAAPLDGELSPARPSSASARGSSSTLTVANPHHAGFTEAELRLAEKVSVIVDEHHPEAVAGS